MNRLYIIIAVLLLVVATSCEKELDFKYHDIEALTVIEGNLTPDGLKVGITLTTSMGEPMDSTRLTDAVVTLQDMTSGTTYSVMPDSKGFFSADIAGIVGHDYRLTVERNGEKYESVTTMYGAVTISSLEFSWIKMPYDHVAVLQGKFTDNPATTGDCYWVKLFRNGKIYKWAEMDDRAAEDDLCTFITMTTRKDTDEEDDDTVLYDGDVITCTVCAISRSMHDYLEALQNNSNGPAMFTGGKCLGYFLAGSPVSDSIVFHPAEIPEQ